MASARSGGTLVKATFMMALLTLREPKNEKPEVPLRTGRKLRVK
jgi:hypothetical protein